jgi:hypothetical protein
MVSNDVQHPSQFCLIAKLAGLYPDRFLLLFTGFITLIAGLIMGLLFGLLVMIEIAASCATEGPLVVDRCGASPGNCTSDVRRSYIIHFMILRVLLTILSIFLSVNNKMY